MNDRIKELALEAFQPINDIASEGIADLHTFNQAWFQLYNQKFAELIVAEVLAVQEKLIADGHNAWHLHKPTKKHFGVEQ